MVDINNPEQCCGCSACSTVCSTHAISMLPDRLGFLYPVVDLNRCIDCGLCNKVCHFENRKAVEFKSLRPVAYAARNRSLSAVMASRSGAVFAALAEHIIEHGGVVYGALFDSLFRVVHKGVKSCEECGKLYKSKYAQSNTIGIFNKVLEDLSDGCRVLFSGTPCQVAALKSVVRGRFSGQIIYVDIVCHGVASPKIWSDYIEYWERVIGEKVVGAEFRDKGRFGWHAHVEHLEFASGKIYSQCFATLFYKHLILRPSCHVCPYASVERCGDITLADFWGWERSLSGVNSDDRGVSLILLSTTAGRRVLNEIAERLDIYPVDIDSAMQPNLLHPSPANPLASDFLKDYLSHGFEYVAKRYGGLSGYRFRVGIATFHFAHNYGAMLQAYALKSTIANCGYSARIIDYRLPEIYGNYDWPEYDRGVGVYRWLWSVGRYVKHSICNRRWRRFERFMKRFLVEGKRLRNENDVKYSDIDALVFGSDQIWNRALTKEFVPLYFGYGAPFNVKRVAFAASNGDGRVKEYEWDEMLKLLQGVNSISVRELALCQFLKKRGIEAIQLPDPIFLLDIEQWNSIASVPKCSNYILVYSFAEHKNFVNEVEQIRSSMDDLPVIHITYNNRGLGILSNYRVVHNAGPLEFLGFISKAKYVITNSFHGTAFALLYKKPLYISMPLQRGERIVSLLQSLGIEPVSGYITPDYESVYEKIIIYRKQALNFLRNSIEG